MDQNKLNRVLESMKETGIEQLLISDPASINYLTGRYVNCMEKKCRYCIWMWKESQICYRKVIPTT